MLKCQEKNVKKGGLGFFILVFTLMMATSLVDARFGEFPARTCVDIKTILNTTAVNISTISFPNTTVAVTSQPMNKSGSTFNFTFCDTASQGVYVYDYVDAEEKVFVNDFLITPIGESIDTGKSLLYIAMLFTNFLFFAIFLTISVVTPYRNLSESNERGQTFITKVTKTKYVKLVAIWIAGGLLLMFLTILTSMANNYILFEEVRQMLTSFYVWFYILNLGLTVTVVWLLFFNLWKDIILNKTILREGKAILELP